MRRGGRGDGAWRPSLFAVLALLVGHAPELHAESVGSPASILKRGRWVMGLGGGALLDRGLKGGGSGDVEATVIQGGHFRGYGLTDWLSLYGKVGGASLEAEDRGTSTDFGGALFLSAQVKGRLWRHVKTELEWDGSVQFVHLRSRHTDDNEGDWNEWQFATSVAKGFGRVKPYVGVKVALVDFDFTLRKGGTITQQDTYQEDGVVGAFIGSDVSFGQSENVVLNVETSYLDGAELSLAITYTF
jgi:hypothetical protein